MSTHAAAAAPADGPLLDVREVVKTFPVRRTVFGRVSERVHAVDGVSFEVAQGETLGLVGESGSGKSTLGRLVLRLVPADRGSVRLGGQPVTSLAPRQLRALRSQMQMVFQDPFASLNPSRTVGDLVAEPLRTHLDLSAAEREARVVEVLRRVGLDAHHRRRYPYEFSGGQRQRIAIARAVVLRPRLVVCDEAVSALDVSTQAQVIGLLEELQEDYGLTYLFIAHDLSVVRHVSDRIAVMYLGRIVEVGPAAEVYDQPRHPYTRALLSAIPVANPRRQRSKPRTPVRGEAPNPMHPPAGCHFHPRCPAVMDVCSRVVPTPRAVGAVSVACHLYDAEPEASPPRAG